MRTVKTDVLVIGSGFGAFAPALRLARAGLRVIMVEKGPAVDTQVFRQTQDPKYITRYLKGLSGEHLNLTYAEALGGGSGFYEMVSLRAPTRAFFQTELGGQALWPAGVTRATLDPWYDLAERMLGVEQIRPDEIPHSGLVFSLLMKNLGLTCDRIPYAVKNCVGSGFCITGCIYGAKQSLHKNYLPQALDAGVQIECDLTAVSIRSLKRWTWKPARTDRFPDLPQCYQVRCQRQNGDREQVTYQARCVILGGGTVGTASLLLASKKYLSHLSPQLGRNIAVNGSVKVVGLLGDHLPDGDMFTGRSHPGMMSFEFLDSHGLSISAAKALPLQAAVGARLSLNGDSGEQQWWGESNLAVMKQLRHRMLVLVGLGLTPPCGVITLGPDGRPAVDLERRDMLSDYLETTRGILESIFTRNACDIVRTEWVDHGGEPHPTPYFSTAHMTGSARMADTWSAGVVSGDGEVFGYPGLYVSDGAAIPSSLAVNTSLTILANAERVAAGVLDRYRLPMGQVL
jgi:choline dehydrogenase-like flavoprotein